MYSDILNHIKNTLIGTEYENSILDISIVSDKAEPSRLEIDVIVSLETLEDRRNLGKLFSEISEEKAQEGYDLVFHQYFKNNYTQSEQTTKD